ncbi:hypothetical protein AB1L88_17820 [Tautonia sp. JC769]|uniref:hypothetical protein n=1 Tax=Tautonia sp. JC769 TaxID=3232135 RepID=UPI00345AB046
MALVFRNGRPYLYRSVRRNGRVTSEFVASGESALLIARMDAIDRDDRDYERWRIREERRKAAERDARLDDLVKQSEALAREALEQAGYHQHHRGEWRRRRVRPCDPDRREAARERHARDGAEDAR